MFNDINESALIAIEKWLEVSESLDAIHFKDNSPLAVVIRNIERIMIQRESAIRERENLIQGESSESANAID
jgi:hypothetical protein